jgi:hypothetical protein
MPRPVLHWVAALLGLTALSSFAMGIINAPEHGGRLPGERVPGRTAGAAMAIDAPEATPLSQERIEGAPPPVEKPAAGKTEEQAAEVTGDEATNGTGPLLNVPPAAANATPPPETIAPASSPEDEPPH